MTLKRRRKVFFWFVLLAVFLFGLDRLLAKSANPANSDLVINEVMAANNTGLTDQEGDYADWLELYNRSREPVNLSGWFLTDDPQQPQKWPFPDISLGSGQYLLVFASGKDHHSDRPGAELHTNFQLNRDGEFLGLYNVLENRLMDTITPNYPAQFSDISYGRMGESPQLMFLGHPTPGGPNDASLAWTGPVSPVKFSRERGFYEAPFTVELSTDTPAAVVRYTTDGSEPTENHGLVYTAPIPVNRTTFVRAAAFKPGLLPSSVNTHTYIFLDNILVQPAKPPGFPNTWGMHPVDFAGYTQGTPVQADYELDPQIVSDPRYGPTLKAGLKAIPTLSIVTAAQNFNIYANPRMKGINWERPASVEWFDPVAGHDFQINAGIRIHGGAGRWEFMPKHSFRLFFRNKYGASQLQYPLFANSLVKKFDTLVLRAGSDRSFAGHPDAGDPRLVTYTRDEWLRDSQIEMNVFGSHGAFVHLYLDGLYWGLYNLVERPNASFMSAYFGGDKKDWYVVSQRGSINGSGDRFEALMTLAEAGGLADPEKYAQVTAYLDVSEFADYLILEWYAGNTDWPQNNWMASVLNPTGQVRYLAWDGEMTWVDGAKLHVGQTNAVGIRNTIKPLFEALSQNPDFKILLADRMYKHLFNNGALTDANAQSRWRKLNDLVEPAIVAESARWGDVRYPEPITPDDWRRASNLVMAQMAGNGAKLITQARAQGYYPEIDPPAFNQHGGLVKAGFELTMAAPLSMLGQNRGGIYYTTDGSDPRQPITGAIAPTAKAYSGPIILTTTTRLKARTLLGDPTTSGLTWSALSEATFKFEGQNSQLALTEMMYRPPRGSDDYEFIELQNVGVDELNLAGLYFDEGLNYTFPPGLSPLAPGERVVLVHDRQAFVKQYPDVAVTGVYRGRLSNKGEKITLRNAAGQVIESFTYSDDDGWPYSPDGHGDSLVIIDPHSDPNNPRNWRASMNLYGSPGAAEPNP